MGVRGGEPSSAWPIRLRAVGLRVSLGSQNTLTKSREGAGLARRHQSGPSEVGGGLPLAARGHLQNKEALTFKFFSNL